MLLGVVKACGKDCSPAVVAKAYMYVGLVRGCGKQNMAGAKEAFDRAKAADPGVALDAALATPRFWRNSIRPRAVVAPRRLPQRPILLPVDNPPRPQGDFPARPLPVTRFKRSNPFR